MRRLAPPRAVLVADLRDGLRVVRVEPASEPGGLLRVTHASRHADAAAGARALRQAGALRGVQQVLLLPTALRGLHALPRPAVPDAELSEAARWALAPNLDHDPGEALVQALPLPALSDSPTQQLLAVVARGPDVRAHLAPLHAAGWAPEVVDIQDTAQRNLMLLAAPDASAGSSAGACVGFAGNEALVTVVAGGELCLTRTVSFDAAQPAAAAERLALQVQRALDAFERQTTRFAVRRLLLLPGPMGTALVAALAAQTHLRVQQLTLPELFEVEAGAAAALEDPADFAHLIGCAAGRLRDLDEAGAARPSAAEASGASLDGPATDARLPDGPDTSVGAAAADPSDNSLQLVPDSLQHGEPDPPALSDLGAAAAAAIAALGAAGSPHDEAAGPDAPPGLAPFDARWHAAEHAAEADALTLQDTSRH